MTRRSHPFRLYPLAAAVILALGCQPGEPGTESDFASRSDPFRIGNGLGTQPLVLNALTANRTSLGLITTGPLNATLFSNAYLTQQLQDPDARTVLGYIVSCALDPTRSLTLSWGTMKGEAGLCPAWESAAPTQECLERVSGCLLARNNAFGQHVPLSMRGEDPTRPALFSLDTGLPTYSLELPTANLHPALGTCPAGITGASRDCGWQPEHIGTCAPGTSVRVGGGGIPPDSCPGALVLGSAGAVRAVLRACDGIGACRSTEALAQSEGSCAQLAPAVSFPCPSSGIFSVLSGGYDASLAAHPAVAVSADLPFTYPAAERDVFGTREGAFYGNVFDAHYLHPSVSVVVTDLGEVTGKNVMIKGAIYRDMWSCWAPGWSDPAGFASSRMCALPGYNCAATSLGACRATPPATTNRCASADGAVVRGDGDFEACLDNNGRTRLWPITTFVVGR